MTTRKCNKCNQTFPATEEFFYKKNGCRHGLNPRCITCHLAVNKDYYHSLPQEEKSRRGKRNNLKHKYDITPEQWDEMFEAQGGACAICKTTNPPGYGNSLHVDHCHDSGTVRGLLCVNCNKGLGHFMDNPELLAAAIEYITLFVLEKR